MNKKFLIIIATICSAVCSAQEQPPLTITIEGDNLKAVEKYIKEKTDREWYNGDWANFARYAQANTELKAAGKKPKAVFMGNSITEGWANGRKDFFANNDFVGRGISGQVTSQMLVRFQADVVDLQPKYVVILAGTNDIAHNQGVISLEHIFQNIKSMCQLAKANNIKPVVCSILPACAYKWRPQVENVADSIKTLNAMLKEYATKNKIAFVDFHPALADENGCLPEKYSHDGVHCNRDAYVIMEKTVSEFLK
ncbi:MAG: SGNH/GDSL hydrolase family protein [Dysgonamonadaceae bacterium]|jgi:lysophospholipase L1-like esterase|nr:SGNH/GDSL hydrolase family protein [Dysgonamonadaceae bacterium]